MSKLNKECVLRLISLVKDLDTANLYRGKGTEIMRNAVNSYLRLIFEAELPIDEETFIYYLDILIDNLKHQNTDLQVGACEAIKVLNENYQTLLESKTLIENIKQKLEHMIKSSIVDENIYVTRGYTMALPFFNLTNLVISYTDVLDCFASSNL